MMSSILAVVTAAAATHEAKNVTLANIVAVVTGKTAAAAPVPKPTPTPTPTPTPVALPKLLALPPLDLSDMRLWNFAGKWLASEWGDDKPLSSKYDHVNQPSGTDTFFTLDSAGEPELQAAGGTPVYTRGLWEADVTLPQLKDGLVVAPLWLWDAGSSDEIDFELAGRKGLDVTLHAPLNGAMQSQGVRLFAGRDMSGERHRFGIKVDEAAGYVEMYLDGLLVHRWAKSTMTFFPSHTLKPILSMWAADPNNAGFVSWVGKWQGTAPGEVLTMTVHGYKYSAIP